MAKKMANITNPDDADKTEDQAEKDRIEAANAAAESHKTDMGKKRVRSGSEAVTEEMVPVVEARLRLSNGSTLQEIGASLAYKFGHPEDMQDQSASRKAMISAFALKVKEWIVKTYGAERRDANGTLIGCGDRIAIKPTSPGSDLHYRLMY